MSRRAPAALLRRFTTPFGFDALDSLVVEGRNAVLLEERSGRSKLGLSRRYLRKESGDVPVVPPSGERFEVLESRVVEREARRFRLPCAHNGTVAHRRDWRT